MISERTSVRPCFISLFEEYMEAIHCAMHSQVLLDA
jgi:hypothetical protein